MEDAELIAQAMALSPVYVDGFGAFRKVNGVLRCVGYVIDGGAQLNLIISLAGAAVANAEARRVIEEKPTKGLCIWNGEAMAH